MNDNQQTLDPMKVLADTQALVRVALESADPVVMRRDLELILTITEEALQPSMLLPRKRHITPHHVVEY